MLHTNHLQEFINTCVISICLFFVVIVLQFESNHSTCVMGLSTIFIARPRMPYTCTCVAAAVLAGMAALLILGDVVRSHVGDPRGFTVVDFFSCLALPAVVPHILFRVRRPRSTKLLFMRCMPIMAILAFLSVLIGIASTDPCVSEHIFTWDQQLEQDTQGQWVPVYKVEIRQITLLVAILGPATSFASVFMIARGLAGHHTMELAASIIAAVCTRYTLVVVTKHGMGEPVTALIAMYLSWSSIAAWTFYHLCDSQTHCRREI